MNFSFTWLMDKLGYMPKFDVKIGKIAEPWPFPLEKEMPKKQAKKKPTVAKATTRKPRAKKND